MAASDLDWPGVPILIWETVSLMVAGKFNSALRTAVWSAAGTAVDWFRVEAEWPARHAPCVRPAPLEAMAVGNADEDNDLEMVGEQGLAQSDDEELQSDEDEDSE